MTFSNWRTYYSCVGLFCPRQYLCWLIYGTFPAMILCVCVLSDDVSQQRSAQQGSKNTEPWLPDTVIQPVTPSSFSFPFMRDKPTASSWHRVVTLLPSYSPLPPPLPTSSPPPLTALPGSQSRVLLQKLQPLTRRLESEFRIARQSILSRDWQS